MPSAASGPPSGMNGVSMATLTIVCVLPFPPYPIGASLIGCCVAITRPSSASSCIWRTTCRRGIAPTKLRIARQCPPGMPRDGAPGFVARRPFWALGIRSGATGRRKRGQGGAQSQRCRKGREEPNFPGPLHGSHVVPPPLVDVARSLPEAGHQTVTKLVKKVPGGLAVSRNAEVLGYPLLRDGRWAARQVIQDPVMAVGKSLR